MSNKVKTCYENKDGTELKPWLDKESNRRMLDNKRILYVVRANIDNSLVKFGIGGVEHGGTSAFGRLLQYVNYYGEGGEFDCKGIKLFLIVANEYNPNVDGKNSAIFRKEAFLKKQLRGDTLSGRGTERVTTNIRKLFNLIYQTSNKTDEDLELERRKSERLEQSNITADDQVMKVTAHITPKTGTGKTLYRTHWSRPYNLTTKEPDKDGKMVTKKKQVYTTDESYKNLINFRDGKEKADEYKAKHPRAKFND
jgi:hypothetical protein